MRNLTRFAFVLIASAGAFVVACRSSGDDGTTPDSPNNNGGMKIQDIQNDSMPSGTAVTLKGVVVTAIDNYGGKKGDIWIEEPGGGPYSGIHVYGAALDQVAALAVGDVVDLTGAQKDEFVYTGSNGSGGFPAGYGITELKPVTGGTMTITKSGGNTPITPDVVDALAIGQMADYMARDAEWEKWEGVLIKVSNVQAMSTDDYVSSKCPGTACPDSTLKSFGITGDIQVESALGPNPTPTVKSGDCIGSVTGVVDYFFNYQILPRDLNNDGTTEDFALANGTCPVENSAALCGDGIDNDGNGFSDCNDTNCILPVASCRDVTTISAIQTATTTPTRGVELQNVVVAALSKPSGQGTATPKNMWVQSDLQAAENDGVYIYGTGASLAAFTPGTRVNIIGRVVEFNDSTGTETQTQIKALQITAGTGTTGAVLPFSGASATVANLSQEKYEGVLVTLTNVKATTLGNQASFGVGDATQSPGLAPLKTDDDMYLINSTSTCYKSITGIWTYLPYNDAWGFLPQDPASLPVPVTTGGNCTN